MWKLSQWVHRAAVDRVRMAELAAPRAQTDSTEDANEEELDAEASKEQAAQRHSAFDFDELEELDPTEVPSDSEVQTSRLPHGQPTAGAPQGPPSPKNKDTVRVETLNRLLLEDAWRTPVHMFSQDFSSEAAEQITGKYVPLCWQADTNDYIMTVAVPSRWAPASKTRRGKAQNTRLQDLLLCGTNARPLYMRCATGSVPGASRSLGVLFLSYGALGDRWMIVRANNGDCLAESKKIWGPWQVRTDLALETEPGLHGLDQWEVCDTTMGPDGIFAMAHSLPVP